MASIIALRNLYFVTTNYSFGFYLDNYVNDRVTNEKFVIAMIIVGAVLLGGAITKRKKTMAHPTNTNDEGFIMINNIHNICTIFNMKSRVYCSR